MREYWLQCETLDDGLDIQVEPGNTFGSGKGNTVPIPGQENVAANHARIKVDGDGRWVVTAIYNEYPVFDKNGEPVLSVVLQHQSTFRIGSHHFVVRTEEQTAPPDNSVDKEGQEGSVGGPIPPPRGVKSLQYFFREKLYRVAVLGGIESGKTCMFAALAMPRIPRADGASCTRIHHLREPVPEPWVKTPEDREAQEAFQEGRHLLDGKMVTGKGLPGAIDQLLQGHVPERTVISSDARIVFKLVGPERNPAMLETVDYAGEFADPRAAVEDQAQRVASIINSSDGLIVLAAAPMLGGDYQKEVEAVDRMAQSFAMLPSDRKIPVVMAVNKWDRRVDAESGPVDYEQQCRALAEYIESGEGQHLKALANALSHAVGPENFTILPVSALGKCEIVDGFERPRQNLPLASFGLEDPFFWLIARADSLAVARYEQDVKALPLWPPWTSLWSGRARTVRRKKDLLANWEVSEKKRLPRIRTAASKLALKRGLAKFQLVVFALAALLLAECVFLSRPVYTAYHNLVRQVEIVSQDDYETSREAVAKLEGYRDSLPFRHALLNLSVNRAAAKRVAAHTQENQRSFLMRGIYDAALPIESRFTKGALLTRDFRDCEVAAPDLEYFAEHKEANAAELFKTFTDATGTIEDRYNAAQKFVDLHPDNARNEAAQRVIDVYESTQRIIENVRRAVDKPEPEWAAFAAALAVPEFRQLEPSFQEQVVEDLIPTVRGRLLTYVNNSIRMLQDDPRLLRSNRYLIVLQEAREHLQQTGAVKIVAEYITKAAARIEEAVRDRRLYQAVSHKDRDACLRDACLEYINQSSKNNIPGFMKSEVDRFLNEPFDGTLIVEKIEWIRGRRSHEREMTLRVTVTGHDTFLYERDRNPQLRFDPETLSRPKNFDMPLSNLALHSDMDIIVEFELHSRVLQTPFFSTRANVNPDELYKGIVVTAYETPATGFGRSARVHLKLDHNHREPEWTARRFLSLDSMDWQ